MAETKQAEGLRFWYGTKAEYDALKPDANTVYLISPLRPPLTTDRNRLPPGS